MGVIELYFENSFGSTIRSIMGSVSCIFCDTVWLLIVTVGRMVVVLRCSVTSVLQRAVNEVSVCGFFFVHFLSLPRVMEEEQVGLVLLEWLVGNPGVELARASLD